jgi:hypothetical protein
MKSLKENEAKETRNKERQVRRDAGEVVDDEAEEKEYLKQNSKVELEENIVQETNQDVKKLVNKKELTEKESVIKSKEKDIKDSKADLQKTQEEVAKYQQKNEKVKKELEEARKVFEEMMAASKAGSK